MSLKKGKGENNDNRDAVSEEDDSDNEGDNDSDQNIIQTELLNESIVVQSDMQSQNRNTQINLQNINATQPQTQSQNILDQMDTMWDCVSPLGF